MKVMDITTKGLKELFRNRKSMAFLLLFPIMFMVIFRVSFGWGAPENETYTIAVVDEDTGEGPWDHAEPAWLPIVQAGLGTNITATQFFGQMVLNGTTSGGEHFVEEFLREAKYEDGKTDMFKVRRARSVAKGEQMVKDEEVSAIVIIPTNFTSAIQGIVDSAVVAEVRAHSIPIDDPMEGYAHASVDLSGALGNLDYSFSSSIVNAYLRVYSEIQAMKVRQMVGAGLPGGPSPMEGPSIGTEFGSIGETEDFVAFDFIAPGILIFGLMMITMSVTANLATEVKNKTLNRLRLTKMSALDMVGGNTLSWLVVGALQTVLLFLVAVAVGVHVAGSLLVTTAAAIVIGIVVVVASIAVGLIISAFLSDPEQASNVATVFMVPLSFFSGAFFEIDLVVTRYLPWTQGATALRQLMLYNDWGAVLLHTLGALVGALVILGIGVLIFHYKRLRRG